MSHLHKENIPRRPLCQKGYPSMSSPCLIWVMPQLEIFVLFRNLDNYWWKGEWQGSEPDVFITVVSNHRRWESLDSSWDLTVYKSVCLKVNRSEEVPRPLDPQVRHDNSIYSLYPWQRQQWQMDRENERADSTSDDLRASFSWIITQLNVTLIHWTFRMFKQVIKGFCWVVIMKSRMKAWVGLKIVILIL